MVKKKVPERKFKASFLCYKEYSQNTFNDVTLKVRVYIRQPIGWCEDGIESDSCQPISA